MLGRPASDAEDPPGAASGRRTRGLLSALLTDALAGLTEHALDSRVMPAGMIELAAKARPGGGCAARISLGYESFSRFGVLAVGRDGTRFRLTLTRRGLDWRLTEVSVLSSSR